MLRGELWVNICVWQAAFSSPSSIHPSLNLSNKISLQAQTSLSIQAECFCHWSCDLQRFGSPEHTLTLTPRCIRGVISTPSCLCYGLIYHNSSFYQTHFSHYSLGHYHIVLWLQGKQRRTLVYLNETLSL